MTWSGDLQGGSGMIESVGSGAFGPLPVSWKARTEEPGGNTSPEELLAASHASCFAMALSYGLGNAGTPPERLDVTATVTFDQTGGFKVKSSALEVSGKVPRVDAKAFQAAAERAKENCAISRALKGNVELSVKATLE